METKTQSPQFLRKREFLIVLPLLVLPFLTLLFWALGGGSKSDVQAQQEVSKQGLNMELPNANLKDDNPLDKLSYYEKAASDSAKRGELMKKDPYYLHKSNGETAGLIINDSIPTSNKYLQKPTKASSHLNTSSYSSLPYQDTNEAKVYKKLEQLNSAMSQASMQSERKAGSYTSSRKVPGTSMNSSDVDKLEQMIAMNQQDGGNEDPEMKQLNGMMEKILDIQHPERVKDKIRQTSEANKGQVFSVNVKADNDFNSLLVNNKSTRPLSF